MSSFTPSSPDNNAKKSFFSRGFIIFLLVCVVVVIAYHLIREAILKNWADKDSVIFNQVQEKISAGNDKGANELLVKLSKTGTVGYKFVSSLQLATREMENKNYQKAIEILNSTTKLSVPSYYKSLAKNISFAIRLDHDKDLKSLIKDLQKVPSDDPFYSSSQELLANALYAEKQYKNALDIIDKINSSELAPSSLKERTKALKAVLLAHVQ